MQLYDVPYEGEPETEAAEAPAHGRIRLPESVEHERQEHRLDSLARILYLAGDVRAYVVVWRPLVDIVKRSGGRTTQTDEGREVPIRRSGTRCGSRDLVSTELPIATASHEQGG